MTKKTAKTILEAYFQRTKGRASERVENVYFAKTVADYMRCPANSFLARIGVSAEELWCFFWRYINSSKSPAKVLHMIAKAHEGKLHDAAPGDEAIKEAYFKAGWACKRYDERSISVFPLLSEVYDAFDKGPSVSWSRPDKDHLRKRLRIWGLPISEDPISQRFKTPLKVNLPRLELLQNGGKD